LISFPVLDSAVKFTNQIRPVRLPSISTENPDFYAGSSVLIMGWGNGTKKTLETADIQVYEERFAIFRSIYYYHIHSQMSVIFYATILAV
jgi:hypothetical protein